jgi:hypothetical protein
MLEPPSQCRDQRRKAEDHRQHPDRQTELRARDVQQATM